MSDRQVKALLAAGLLAQAVAATLAFTRPDPWPLPAAAVLVAGIAAVLLPKSLKAWALVAAVLGSARFFSAAPGAVAATWTAFAVEALFQAALLIFLLTFRMTRLW